MSSCHVCQFASFILPVYQISAGVKFNVNVVCVGECGAQAVESEDVNCVRWMFVSLMFCKFGYIINTSCMGVVRERNKY